jgi:tRNA(Ile)-lysidine synthase TilS/MesJ
VDAYGRSDVLKDLYDIDNNDFIRYLKEKNFYVAEDSHSNYNQTRLSLASSLNME